VIDNKVQFFILVTMGATQSINHQYGQSPTSLWAGSHDVRTIPKIKTQSVLSKGLTTLKVMWSSNMDESAL
jgi:hypothetical protein